MDKKRYERWIRVWKKIDGIRIFLWGLEYNYDPDIIIIKASLRNLTSQKGLERFESNKRWLM